MGASFFLFQWSGAIRIEGTRPKIQSFITDCLNYSEFSYSTALSAG